jgi:hypothetical protein
MKLMMFCIVFTTLSACVSVETRNPGDCAKLQQQTKYVVQFECKEKIVGEKTS